MCVCVCVCIHIYIYLYVMRPSLQTNGEERLPGFCRFRKLIFASSWEKKQSGPLLRPFYKLAAHKLTSFGSNLLGSCLCSGGFRHFKNKSWWGRTRKDAWPGLPVFWVMSPSKWYPVNNTPFTRAFALQNSSRNCSAAFDLALWKRVFPHVFFFSGVFFLQTLVGDRTTAQNDDGEPLGRMIDHAPYNIGYLDLLLCEHVISYLCISVCSHTISRPFAIYSKQLTLSPAADLELANHSIQVKVDRWLTINLLSRISLIAYRWSFRSLLIQFH